MNSPIITRILFSAAFLASIALSASATPEQPRQVNRPKVGLVLAGGGALGIAHVGVLKVLEEHRIPVDVITGTSMGSIVGAAYASGASVSEMEEILSETDWDALFKETLKREDVEYRNKYGRAGQFLGDAKIGFKGGGSLARFSGVVAGQHVVPLLQRLYHRTPGNVDFNSLPVPFCAVAADIETGEAIPLRSGELAYATRASMAVPGFFTPVELEGRMLVDGGIANNLPVDLALEMGAEKLIVVDLVVDLKKKEDLGSVLGIGGQIISLLLQQNSMLQRKNMRKGDLLIIPELKGFGASDFTRAKEILARGEVAANQNLEQLKRFSVSEQEYAAYRAHREGGKVESPIISSITVASDNAALTPVIEKRLMSQVGKPLDTTELERAMDSIYAGGGLASIGYEVQRNADGTNVLEVNAKKPSWYDRYLQVGFSLQDDFQGDSAYQLALGGRFNELNRAGGFLDLRLDIGWRPLLEVDLYQPFARDSGFFVNPILSLDRYEVPVRVEGETIAQYQRSRAVAGLGVGRKLGRGGELQIGVRRGSGEIKRHIGDPSLGEGSYQIGSTFGQISFDSRDTPDFATTGTLFDLQAEYNASDLGSSEDFTQLQGSFQKPITYGASTFLLSSDYGTSFQTIAPARVYVLGGMFDLAGYQPGSLAASDFVIGRLTYYRELASLGGAFAKLNLFGGGSFEMASLKSDLAQVDDNSGIVGGMLFVGADTPIVPLYFAAGMNNDDEASFYLNIGRIFRPRR